MYMSLDDLHEAYEGSQSAQQYRLNFNEYAILCRVMEGVKLSHVYTSLYLSNATVSRAKSRLIHKLKTKSFEQVLVKVGQLNLIGH